MTRRTIRIWYLVHKWASLIPTLFLLMLCLTGLPLIFHDEIARATDDRPPLAALPPGTPWLSLDTLLARAMAGRAHDVPIYVSFDVDRPVANVTSGPTPDAAPAAMHFQSLDRRSGAVLPPAHSGIVDVLLRIHTDLYLGLPAELILGVMGILFLIAIVSGVVLYAPFMAKLEFGTVRRGRSTRLRWLDLHNLLGIVTIAWAAVVAISGAVNSFAIPVTDLWKADELAAMSAPYAGQPVPTKGLSSLQAALDTAMRAAPGMRPQFVAFPGAAFSSSHHYAVFLQGVTPLTAKLLTPALIDARSGVLTAVRPMPWYMQALLLAQPLHFGDYGGLPMKLLWALLDVVTIVVLGSGIYLWLGRKA